MYVDTSNSLKVLVKYRGAVTESHVANYVLYAYVTLLHLRSKEITGIHKPCIPHSNDSNATTEYKPVCIQM